jgi:hypothetical protein
MSQLSVNANGTYAYEEALLGSGGGVSAIFSYQQTMASQAVAAALVSTTMRNVPDVVLYPDQAIVYNGSWQVNGGTSAAAPIWAALISLVNQGPGQYAPIGFANPALYEIAQSSSAYANDFHDITMGNNGYYPAEPGFDDATGLGSLNGLNLYNDLVEIGLAQKVGSFVKTLPTSGSAGAAVEILGTNLGGATKVAFNDTAAVFTLVSPSLISAAVPPGAATGYVTVTTPSGTLFSNVPFVVFVTTQPTSGSVGAAVRILGESLTGATGVTFNGTAATFTVVSSTLISTTVPAGATTGEVQVTTPSGKLFSNVPFVVQAPAPPTVALSAAGQVEPFAAQSIVSAYGANLATGTASASSLPLPTSLADTTVTVTDYAGVARTAPLF